MENEENYQDSSTDDIIRNQEETIKSKCSLNAALNLSMSLNFAKTNQIAYCLILSIYFSIIYNSINNSFFSS